jgi:hypothetical protein
MEGMLVAASLLKKLMARSGSPISTAKLMSQLSVTGDGTSPSSSSRLQTDIASLYNFLDASIFIVHS